MKVLITGANGFIGKNLQLRLSERKDVDVVCFTRSHDLEQLPELLQTVDFVFHLAGVNRPQDPLEFFNVNADLTSALSRIVIDLAQATGRRVPIIYTSSIQAECDNLYGQSKLAGEMALQIAANSHGIPIHIFRLPNVFGKWCRPNYNSVVATFCYNIARDLPVHINDAAAKLTLVYVDDVIERFLQLMDSSDAHESNNIFTVIAPQYITTVGKLMRQIQAFKNSRTSLMTERVGAGLVRALYATYVSYLPVESFAYSLPQYADSRGVFAEMLKTPDCGQFSFFTAHPGITRGGHYHHSKTEKFLVIKGQARFRFRHMQTGQTHELVITGDNSEIVETVPGWTHDITNIGTDDMVVMLWANEVFDRTKADTFANPL